MHFSSSPCNICHPLLTYLLTPWCKVFLEKLTGLQLVKKFPAFHGTRRFITALTSLRHPSLTWASPIQSTNPHPTSWRYILILSTHLRLGLPSALFPSGFPNQDPIHTPSGNFGNFVQPDSSLQYLHHPLNFPYTKPDESTPAHPSYYFNFNSILNLPATLNFLSFLFNSGSPINIL